jgi:signal peptidase II
MYVVIFQPDTQERYVMKKIILILSIVFLAILCDQLSKGALLYLITGGVPLFGDAWDVVPVPYLMTQVCDYFNIVFTWNPGASFSLFRALGESTPMLIIVATGIVIGCIAYYTFARAKSYEYVPLALILGGAIGNLIDRIRFGAVVDFLDFHIGALRWPAFNVADICIVVGVGLYLINVYVARRRCINKTKGVK